MKLFWILMLSISLLGVGACGKSERSGGASSPATSPSGAKTLALPVTLEGQFSLDHSNDSGVWGTFSVNGTDYHVSIPAEIYEPSSLGDSGGPARLTLSTLESKSSPSDIDIYRVSAAAKR